MRKRIFISLLLILFLVLQGCSYDDTSKTEPRVTYDPSVISDLESNNIEYTKKVVETQVSKTSYGYTYENMPNSKVSTTFEFYILGKLVNKINKDIIINNDLNRDNSKNIFALTIIRPILQDNKPLIQWMLEHNNGIALMTYDDFFPKLNKYNVDIEQDIIPEKDVEVPVITFYANQNKAMDLKANKKLKGTKEYAQYYLDNYEYVYFLKFKYINN